MTHLMVELADPERDGRRLPVGVRGRVQSANTATPSRDVCTGTAPAASVVARSAGPGRSPRTPPRRPRRRRAPGRRSTPRSSAPGTGRPPLRTGARSCSRRSPPGAGRRRNERPFRPCRGERGLVRQDRRGAPARCGAQDDGESGRDEEGVPGAPAGPEPDEPARPSPPVPPVNGSPARVGAPPLLPSRSLLYADN